MKPALKTAPCAVLVIPALLLCLVLIPGLAVAGEPPAPGVAAAEIRPSDDGESPAEPSPDAGLTDENLDFLDEEGENGAVGKGLADPLEPFNRAVFKFNDKLYLWVLKPVAKGYGRIAPQPVRKGVENFFGNLAFPVRFVNCALQGKGRAAEGELARFMANSTFGCLGFIDLGEKHPELAPPDPEDTGQTLGKWGLGDGFYLVLPFFGPSTARDALGTAVDRAFLTPVSYVEPMEASMGISAFDKLNEISLSLGDYEAMKDAAFDPYTSARDAYMQYRKARLLK